VWWLLIPAATFLGGLAVRQAAKRVIEQRPRGEDDAPAEDAPALAPPPAAVELFPTPAAPVPPPIEPEVPDPDRVRAAPPVAPPDRPLSVSDFAQRWVSPVLEEPIVPPPKSPEPARAPASGWTAPGIADAAFAALMGVLFSASLLWDWQHLLRTVSVSGFIGWATNWVAIRMLFRPLEPRPILGQGLIPRRRHNFFENISRAVVENLISEEILHQEIERSGLVRKAAREQIDSLRTVLGSAEFRRDFHDLILTYVHRVVNSPEFRGRLRAFVEFRLNVGLEGWTGRDMKGKMVEALKPLWKDQVRDEVLRNLEEVVREIPGSLPHFFDKLDDTIDSAPDYLQGQEAAITLVLTRAVTGFVRSLNVRDIILGRLNLLPNEYLERTVRKVTERQLEFITVAGGVLGAVGGLVIWSPYFVLVLPVLGAAVWGLDELLMRRRRAQAAESPLDPAQNSRHPPDAPLL